MLNSRFKRRSFLKTVVATGACGLGRPLYAVAEAAASKQLVDTQVYVGGWPHAYVPDCDPAALAAMLRRHGVSQAWAGSFDGLFHKDVAGVNERLADACESVGDKFLVPFGTINPTLPDWEDDVRRCHEQHHMRGIRLHPNYHGYTLEDSRFGRLLELATERKLIVQIVAWLADARHAWLSPTNSHVDLMPLAPLLAKVRGVRMVIVGGLGDADANAIKSLARMGDVYFDRTSWSGAKSSPRNPPDWVLPEQLVFASGAPLQSVAEAIVKAGGNVATAETVLRAE